MMMSSFSNEFRFSLQVVSISFAQVLALKNHYSFLYHLFCYFLIVFLWCLCACARSFSIMRFVACLYECNLDVCIVYSPTVNHAVYGALNCLANKHSLAHNNDNEQKSCVLVPHLAQHVQLKVYGHLELQQNKRQMCLLLFYSIFFSNNKILLVISHH